MAKGLGVVSGSSTVVLQATDDGAFIVGRDKAATIQMSGTLNLRIVGTTSGNNKWLRLTGSDGFAIWSAMSASVISNVPLGNLTSSTVQDALNELQDSINGLSAGSAQYTFSDGVNSELVNGDGATMTWTGSVDQTEVTYNPANNRYTIGLGRNIVHTGTLTTGPLTASNGARVLAGGITVDSGLSSLQTVSATSITSSQNVDVGQTLTVSGSTTLGVSGSNVSSVVLNGQFRMPIFTTTTIPAAFGTSPQDYKGYAFYLQGPGDGGINFNLGDKWYFNEQGTWFPSMFFSGS